MTGVDFSNIRTQSVSVMRDRDEAVSFDNAENGAIVFLSSDKRRRSGKIDYDQFVEKVAGTTELAEIPGISSPARGGFLWVDPNDNNSNRSRLIFAYGNIVYLYSVENEKVVVLRDIGTEDGKSISFFNGRQAKKTGIFAIGDSTVSQQIYTYAGTIEDFPFTAVADYSGTVAGTIKITATNHSFVNGNTINISGSTNYDGEYVITVIDSDNFYVTAPFVATESGTFSGERLLLETRTALSAPRLLGLLENRMMASGVGSGSNRVQYSEIDVSGNFPIYTSSTDLNGGGVLSGVYEPVTALWEMKGTGYVFEQNRITPHVITSLDVSGTGRIKDTQTIVQNDVIDGNGVDSPKAVTSYNNQLIWVNRRGIFTYGERGLKEATKPFRPLFNGFSFENASIDVYEDRNQAIITCSTSANVADNFQFIWSFDTQSLSFVSDKFVNQVFYDPVNKLMLGLGSTKAQVLNVYDQESFVNEDDNVSLLAETRMYDMGDETMKKDFVALACKVVATNKTQEFLFEVFIDDEESPSVSFTRNMADSVSTAINAGTGPWAAIPWASGRIVENEDLFFANVLFEGFVPRFDKMSVKITENSPYYSAVSKPTIRYQQTNHPTNSFDTRF